jgi:copper chaperone
MTELRFLVPGISCRHCESAITAEVAKARGVQTVQVEPGTNWVVVFGHDLDIDDIRAAVMQAGHEAEL